MINAILSSLIVFVAIFISTKNPLLAGLLAIFPIKIITTVIGTGFNIDTLFAMMVGQFIVGVILFVVWVIVK